VTITVTCYSWAPSSGDHLFSCGAISRPPQAFISVTFWVELNVNKVTCRKLLFSWWLLHTFNIVSKKSDFSPPLLQNTGDGPDCSKRYCD